MALQRGDQSAVAVFHRSVIPIISSPRAPWNGARGLPFQNVSSKIRPIHGAAAGFVFTCALATVVHYVATPLPPEPATSRYLAWISADASAGLTETAAPLRSNPTYLTETVLQNGARGSRADRGLLLTRQCLALAERDPLAAMEMAAANQLHEIDPGLGASLMAQWAKQDFARAYAWTKAQEPGAWRDDMLARLAFLRAQTDPFAAADLVATDMSGGRIRDEAVISVIHQWAMRDPRSAGRWAQSLPDPSLRERASNEIAALAIFPPAL